MDFALPPWLAEKPSKGQQILPIGSRELEVSWNFVARTGGPVGDHSLTTANMKGVQALESFLKSKATSMPGPDLEATGPDPASCAWITLITRASYLPGVVMLVHTLDKHSSTHPIVVQYTSKLEEDCIACLKSLSTLYPLMHVQLVEGVPLAEGHNPIAARFDDTLTKLRAFQPFDSPQQGKPEPPLEQQPQQVCFLDSDIMIFRNMDDIFTIPRPSSDWISAHHACICNVDNDPWAPPEWSRDTCPNTPLEHPSALSSPGPVPSASSQGAKPTDQLMNSGVFVCTPSKDLWDRIEHFRVTDPRVKDFAFPDQNFLDEFFKDHWVPIGWQYNAVKTSRYWHQKSWRDEEVRALHYIVDKPWEAKVKDDGTAGYLGRDGVTHSWWWREFDDWKVGLPKKGNPASGVVMGVTEKYMLKNDGLGETRYQK
jgi:inositol 3-alpha-galactosyltransferase